LEFSKPGVERLKGWFDAKDIFELVISYAICKQKLFYCYKQGWDQKTLLLAAEPAPREQPSATFAVDVPPAAFLLHYHHVIFIHTERVSNARRHRRRHPAAPHRPA
jgi:hypothetical protein